MIGSRTPSIRGTLALAVVALAGSVPPPVAQAACNVIPSTVRDVRGARGSVDRPFVRPGAFVTIGPPLVPCDDASLPALPATGADAVVTILFGRSDGGPRNVVVLAADCSALTAGLNQCGSRSDVGETACVESSPLVVERQGTRRIQVRFPETDALLGDPADGRGLAGPATIAVTGAGDPLPCGLAATRCTEATNVTGLRACIDELYARDGTCRTGLAALDPTFGHFTALPPANEFRAVCTDPASVCTGTASAVQIALDAAGNLLVPMDWRGVVDEHDGVPIPRLLRGHTAIQAVEALTGPIALPSAAFLASFAPEGALLPPIFTPQLDPTAPNELALFGSADAPETVLRVARRGQALACASGTRDGLPCMDSAECPGGTCGPGRRFFACAGGTHDGRPCTADGECPGGSCGATTTCSAGARAGAACATDADCPNAECGPSLFDFAARAEHGSGLLIVPRLDVGGVCETGAAAGETCADSPECGGGACVAYRFAAEGSVPLDGLDGTENLFTFTASEPILGQDLNGDGDIADRVTTLRDRASGGALPIGAAGGLATATVLRAGFRRPAVAGEGDVVAFLESEAQESAGDVNANGRATDRFLRVFRRDGGGAVLLNPGGSTPADGAARVSGSSVAVSEGRVFFRASEERTVPLGTSLASVTNAGAQFEGCENPALSADGRFLAFTEPVPQTFLAHIHVRDRLDAATVTVNVNASGTPIAGSNSIPAISGDGRYVTFASEAPLVAGDTNGVADVFVRDLLLGTTTRASVASTGMQATGPSHSGNAAVSADGRLVAFVSDADDLVAGDLNGVRDVFVHDRDTGVTTRASVASDGSEADGPSGTLQRTGSLAISADGRFVAFLSDATNLVPGDGDGLTDLFVRDRVAGTTTLVGRLPELLFAPVSLSADGARLGVTGLRNAVTALAHDRLTDGTVPASPTLDGNSVGGFAMLSGNGHRMAFMSFPNVSYVEGFVGAGNSIYVHDLASGEVEAVSVDSAGVPANTHSGPFVSGPPGAAPIAVSHDGRVIAFQTQATNLGPGVDANGPDNDIFVREPIGDGTDLTGDGDADDVVLQVLDASDTPPVTPSTLCPAGDVAVSTGRAAFLRPESAGSATGCPAGPAVDGGIDLDGDGTASAEIVHLWDGAGVRNLRCPATAVALSPAWVGALVSEPATGTDRNGDGDGDDAVAAVHRVAGPDGAQCANGTWVNLGRAALAVEVRDLELTGGTVTSIAAVLVSEAADGGDLSGNGSLDDSVLELFALDAATNDATPLPGGRQAASLFVIGDEGLIGMITPEAAGADLNGDGDTADDVLQVYDVRTGVLHNSGQTVVPCSFAACDPRHPLRVGRDTVKFLTLESLQGDDLNRDGDTQDLVVQIFDPRAGSTRVVGTVDEASASAVNPLESSEGTPVFPAAGRCLEPGPACTSDAECGPAARCVDDLCRIDHGACATNDDCPAVATCDTTVLSIIALADTDGDGTTDALDACPSVPDAGSGDTDGDGVGDACDLATCGNGDVEIDEACDDGNRAGGDGCNATCVLEPSTTTSTTVVTSTTIAATVTTTTVTTPTTTLPAPGCTATTPAAGIGCRLGDLRAAAVAAGVSGGPLQKLDAALARVEAAGAGGPRKRVRAAIRRALAAMGAFRRAVGSRAVRRRIGTDRVLALRAMADALRNDLKALRTSSR